MKIYVFMNFISLNKYLNTALEKYFFLFSQINCAMSTLIHYHGLLFPYSLFYLLFSYMYTDSVSLRTCIRKLTNSETREVDDS